MGLPSDDDEEEEENKGPDVEEAKRRFSLLKRQHNKLQKVLKEKGEGSKEAKAQREKLSEAFACFKLVPKHFDEIVSMARDALDIVRKEEKQIMSLVVRDSKVPRDLFRKEYVGSEVSATWINKLTKVKTEYASSIEKNRPEITRSQKKLKILTKVTDLSIAQIKDINRKMSLGEAKARRAKNTLTKTKVIGS